MNNEQECDEMKQEEIEYRTEDGDHYDGEVRYLTENWDDVYDAWNTPSDWVGRGGSLFGHVTLLQSTGVSHLLRPDGKWCGCLVQIRKGDGDVAWWPEVTNEIRRDTRLPTKPEGITVESLDAFAEWQRRIDVLREQEVGA
jgi:hypothetical protein